MKAHCTLLGQCRVNANLTLSVLRENAGGRFLLFVDTTRDFLGTPGPQVFEVTDEQTARYFARCFGIPEPTLFVEHCPHMVRLGRFGEVFPKDVYWQTVVTGPSTPGAYE
ncbi:MAG: hypothetical protein K2X87_19300 [Gemmataceae bacterium]|nr:hypothetical protein [Gemmataceae bacterium]